MQVPKGSEAIWARIDAADEAVDLDLYLFDFTGKQPELKAKSTGVGSKERVSVPTPAAGRWVVLVDAFAVGGGRTEYDYLDVVTNPRFGSVHVADASEERAAGASWTAKAHAWIASPPEAPRRIYGIVPVVSPFTHSVVGRGAASARAPALLGFVELPLAGKSAEPASGARAAGR